MRAHQLAPGPASCSDVLEPPSLPAPPAAGERLARPDPRPGRCAAAGPSPARGAGTMVLSVPVIALGATLGTATSILALCGVTCLCRHMHPKKGMLQRDLDPDPEKAKPGVLRSQQVRGGGALVSPGRVGSPRQRRGSGWQGMVGVLLCTIEHGGVWGRRTCSGTLGGRGGSPEGLGVEEGSGRIMKGMGGSGGQERNRDSER